MSTLTTMRTTWLKPSEAQVGQEVRLDVRGLSVRGRVIAIDEPKHAHQPRVCRVRTGRTTYRRAETELYLLSPIENMPTTGADEQWPSF
jgi:hypothetical protein